MKRPKNVALEAGKGWETDSSLEQEEEWLLTSWFQTSGLYTVREVPVVLSPQVGGQETTQPIKCQGERRGSYRHART